MYSPDLIQIKGNFKTISRPLVSLTNSVVITKLRLCQAMKCSSKFQSEQEIMSYFKEKRMKCVAECKKTDYSTVLDVKNGCSRCCVTNSEYCPDWYRAGACCTYLKNELFRSGAIKFPLLNRYFISLFLLFSGENQICFLSLWLLGLLLSLSVGPFSSVQFSCLIFDQDFTPTNLSLTHVENFLRFSQGKLRFDVLREQDIDRILDAKRLELKAKMCVWGGLKGEDWLDGWK